ncbi:MAG: DUF4339 domain-containing protein [Opitutaceae bacterium]|jgi:hypothetical protein|nr:DUF4339 domain-containing protein [Opitutaceae bacterium]
MSQHEYYIRQPSDAESHGPFTLKHLSDLAGSGGLDSKTLYFDADTDRWLSIGEAPELAALLRENASRQTPAAAAPSPVASGLVTALLFAGGLALIFPAFPAFAGGGTSSNISASTSAAAAAFLRHPWLWLGVLDLLLGLCCLAFGHRFFRFVRIRAGLGIGFLGALFWLQADTGAFVASLVASACLWLATTLTSRNARMGNAIAGLAAFVALAYCLLP